MTTIEEIHVLFNSTTGVCTDTRKVEKDKMFFALKGDNFNGNKFAAKALEDGCKFAVIDEEEYAVNDRCILVQDVLKCLQELANYHRKQFDIPVIGITGSNGKTTSKELIGAVLETTYNVLVTQGNLNNHIGVPLTLLQLNEKHEIAIIEMGANKPGDIKELVEIAEPNHGLITNIGTAHIEGFGSFEGVLKTKSELYDWIEKVDGKIFINHDDPVLNSVCPQSLLHVTYGVDDGYVKGKLTHLTPFVHFAYTNERYQSPVIETQLVGKYNFYNFLAAIAVGVYLEVDVHDINKALENYTPSNNRSQVTKTETNTVIVDCYNANPSSMKVALESFVEIENGKRIAILGDMLELGNISEEEHQNVLNFLEENNLDSYVVGAEFAKVTNAGNHFNSTTELLEHIKNNPIQNTLVLLKGSRGIKLEQVMDLL